MAMFPLCCASVTITIRATICSPGPRLPPSTGSNSHQEGSANYCRGHISALSKNRWPQPETAIKNGLAPFDGPCNSWKRMSAGEKLERKALVVGEQKGNTTPR